jgi:hypothetical protein
MIGSSDRRALVLGCAIAAAIASPARVAQASPATPSESELAAARALYHDGVLLHREDKLDEARAKIVAAYRTAHTPVIALELAKIEAQLGHLAAAYGVARAVDDMPSSPRETDKGRDARREAAALAASLRGRTATLRIASPSGIDGAEIRVDGDASDEAAGTGSSGSTDIVVDPGAHVVAIVAAGRTCASDRVSAQPGEARDVDLRDRAVATCAPPASNDVASRDPEPSTDSPPTPAPAPAVEPRDAPATSPTRWFALGLAGAGAVTAGVGGVIALRAKSQYDSVAEQCPFGACTPSAFEVREQARAHANGATYAIALGLVGAAAGVALWFYEGSREHDSTKVGVAVTGAGASLVVRH